MWTRTSSQDGAVRLTPLQLRPLLVPLLIAAPLASALAQNRSDTSRTAQDSALRVFFDCQGFASGCDFDYVRTEITFVNWVRNREDAQVHVLVTIQTTGSGGTEYTVTLIGRGRFVGRADTLRYVAGKTDTQDDQRRGLVHLIKLGLASAAATTPLAPHLEVTFTAPSGSQQPAHDPWNYWVYSANLNGFFNGQKSINSQSLFGSLSANRVTDASKILLSFTESYDRGSYDIPVVDSTGAQVGKQTVVSIARSYGGDALLVKSLGAHWSAGSEVSANRSTFSNEDLVFAAGPALEYDIFPYSASTRRLLRFNYRVAVNYFKYADTTIFGKTSEVLFTQALAAVVNVTQPWGSSSVSLTGTTFLHDLSKNRVELFGSLSFRVVRGLSFNVFGNVSLVHDQLFLPKAGASESQILLQRRALATNYQYFASVGLSYSFGSAINNIVNPRFGRTGGGSTIIISN
jgi:hypothetical protein